MKKLNKLTALTALSLSLILAMPNVLPFVQTTVTAEASTIQISKKTASLKVGKGISLKISGTKKKVTWKSGKKAVASVSSTGKVTAKSAGSTTITGTVDGKKYTCKVKVTKPANKNVINAPFKAKEAKFVNTKIIIPKNWKLQEVEVSGEHIGILDSPSSTTESGIALTLIKTNEKKPKYQVSRKLILESYTEEFWKKQMEKDYLEVTVSNRNVSDLNTDHGTVLKMSFDVKVTPKGSGTATGAAISTEGIVNYKLNVYCIYIDNYFFQVSSVDGDNADMDSIAKYIIKTFTVNK